MQAPRPVPRRFARIFAAVACALLAGGCATVSKALRPLGLTTAPGYAYELEIVGVGGKLADRLEEASILHSKRHEPPSTLQGLRRRTQADRDIFLRVLRSRGFFDGEVEWEIDGSEKPAVVSMRVTRKDRYRFARFDIVGLPEDAKSLATTEGLESLGVQIGNPALAETVLAAETALLAGLAERGYPYVVLPPRRALIDRRAHTMEVTVQVDPGPKTTFGEVRVEGATTVDEDIVLGRMKFRRGELFSPGKVEETRKALFTMGVFSGVSIGWGTRADVSPGGEAPIRVTVTEGKMRSVGLGLNFSSADGFGGLAFWEHRNVLGGAERFRAEIDINEDGTTGGISFRKPDFWAVDQNLLLEAKLVSEEPPAYDRNALSLSAGLERAFSRRLVASGGLMIEQDDVNASADPEGVQRFTLIGVPLGLRYDASNNLLDPSRGHRTLLSATPFFSVLGDDLSMLLMRLTESFYVALDDKKRQVWATRLTLGSVVGPQPEQLPADKRLYAGGSDTLRGYEYQFAGPIVDTNTDPTRNPKFKPQGGRSLLNVGTELRWKVTDTIGLVPFVEGAGVYSSSYPDLDEEFLWAAGLGLRYFTIAGPIRVDLGFPLNPRQSDDIFQIYISLGQAF